MKPVISIASEARWRTNTMTMTLLTSREQEIASLASTGLSNKGIARRLELSEGTVKVHLHNIFQKTGVSNRTALVALWFPMDTTEFVTAAKSEHPAVDERGCPRSSGEVVLRAID